MGTYGIPRNVKGEARILMVFSTKALIYSAIGASAGVIVYLILTTIGFNGIPGIIVGLILGAIGFSIATLKVPDTNAFEITKKTGGEAIDDVLRRAIKFKRNKNKIYVYMKGVNKDE